MANGPPAKFVLQIPHAQGASLVLELRPRVSLFTDESRKPCASRIGPRLGMEPCTGARRVQWPRSNRPPTNDEVQRLGQRNEALMRSPHPLRRTLELSLILRGIQRKPGAFYRFLSTVLKPYSGTGNCQWLKARSTSGNRRVRGFAGESEPIIISMTRRQMFVRKGRAAPRTALQRRARLVGNVPELT